MTPSMIIAVIGAVTGILGTVTAVIAIVQTRKANQLAKDANSISQRALSVSADQTVYDWRFEFDQESSTLTVTNDSPNPAMDVTVSVRHKGMTIAESDINYMDPFENALFKCARLSEKIRDSQQCNYDINTGKFISYGPGNLCVDLAVTWTSALGMIRSEKFEQTFS
ncbi:hypothetical protein [Bifidobacterium coryneforme]|uniref:hypothetical protein n=1 Tax=Bifidobacterium coryneforme TaxID=1687 RepID=UPI0004E5D753|nr:hypothetical protein [Bifidobacterium coryneforme]AII74876.1 hypothetical protein BCOR_0866 [Bifidobacterium coryneforme]